MTRRRRTSSPSSPRKRAQFEIPVSLQHFSAISRTLAQQNPDPTDRGRTDAARTTAAGQSAAESSHVVKSESSASSPKPSDRFNQPKQPLTASQPWHPPPPLPPPPPHRTQLPPPDSIASNHSLVENHTYTHDSGPVLAHSQSSTMLAIQAQQFHEPTARPGETLSLARHPNQIAALIAKKRAENEANKNRERWAIAQQSYWQQKTANPTTTVYNLPMPSHQNHSTESRDGAHLVGGEDLSTTRGNQQGYSEGQNHQQIPNVPQAENTTLNHVGHDTIFTSPPASSRSLNHSGNSHSTATVSARSSANTPQSLQKQNQPPMTTLVETQPSHTYASTESMPIPPLFSDQPRHSTSQPQSVQPRSVQRPKANSSFPRQPQNPPLTQPLQVQPPPLTTVPSSGPQPQGAQHSATPGYYKLDPRLWTAPTASNATGSNSVPSQPSSQEARHPTVISHPPQPVYLPSSSSSAPAPYYVSTGSTVPPGHSNNTNPHVGQPPLPPQTRMPVYSTNILGSNYIPAGSNSNITKQAPSPLPPYNNQQQHPPPTPPQPPAPPRPPSSLGSTPVQGPTGSNPTRPASGPPAQDIGGINTTFRHATRDAFAIPKR